MFNTQQKVELGTASLKSKGYRVSEKDALKEGGKIAGVIATVVALAALAYSTLH